MPDKNDPIDPATSTPRQWTTYEQTLRGWIESVPGNSPDSVALLLDSLNVAFIRRDAIATAVAAGKSPSLLNGEGWSVRLPANGVPASDGFQEWAAEMIMGLLQEIAAREVKLINMAVRSRNTAETPQ